MSSLDNSKLEVKLEVCSLFCYFAYCPFHIVKTHSNCYSVVQCDSFFESPPPPPNTLVLWLVRA